MTTNFLYGATASYIFVIVSLFARFMSALVMSSTGYSAAFSDFATFGFLRPVEFFRMIARNFSPEARLWTIGSVVSYAGTTIKKPISFHEPDPAKTSRQKPHGP